MKQAEELDIVDTGMGHGTVKDLEKLSKLDIDSLESLLDTETWGKKDETDIMALIAAKKQGREVMFDDGGFWGDDKITYGEEGTAEKQYASAGKPGMKVDPATEIDGKPPMDMEARMAQRMEDLKSLGHLQTPDSSVSITPEIMGQLQEIDKLRGTGELTEAQQAWADLQQPLTQEQQVAISPDKQLADNLATAATTEGSIFTHDTNIETALWDIWEEQKPFFGIETEGTVGVEGEKELPLTMLPEGDSTEFSPQMSMFGNAGMPVPIIDVSPTAPMMGTQAEMIPSGALEQSLITKMMEIEKQASAGAGGGTNTLNTQTTMDNSVRTVINQGSTAHAPGVPAGSGQMGIGSRG